MEIKLNSNHRKKISIAAQYYNQSIETFIVQSALEVAENISQNKDLISEIDLFIDNSRPSLWIDVKKFLSEYIKILINKYFLVAASMYVIFLYLSKIYADNLSITSSDFDKSLVLFLLALSLVSILLMLLIVIVNLFISSFNYKGKIEKSKVLRQKKNIEYLIQINLLESYL